MKPTQEIIDELRKEAAHPPTPARVAGLFTEAADRIEHLYASGIHTCHADCQRPMCVLRRERDKAHADLARVTAELEHHKSVKETIDSAHKELSREHAALRARSAELEAALRDMRDACKGEPAMNHQKYDALGIRVNNLLARAESATPDKQEAAR